MELSLKLLVLYKKNKKHRGRGAVLGFCILIVGWNWHFLLSLRSSVRKCSNNLDLYPRKLSLGIKNYFFLLSFIRFRGISLTYS